MTWEDLKHRPRFADIAAELVAFAQGASWVIHNAPFDVAFLDAELERAGLPACATVYGALIDTISNAHRTLHGALLDARLLADVYLAMTRGQETLSIDISVPIPAAVHAVAAIQSRWTLEVVAPSADELALHREYLEALERESRGRCVWLRLEGVAEAAA